VREFERCATGVRDGYLIVDRLADFTLERFGRVTFSAAGDFLLLGDREVGRCAGLYGIRALRDRPTLAFGRGRGDRPGVGVAPRFGEQVFTEVGGRFARCDRPARTTRDPFA